MTMSPMREKELPAQDDPRFHLDSWLLGQIEQAPAK
tara:strand:+ start:207 stop:314 length:108 start_codon:yes stop_codon:yes gene_type:complete